MRTFQLKKKILKQKSKLKRKKKTKKNFQEDGYVIDKKDDLKAGAMIAEIKSV